MAGKVARKLGTARAYWRLAAKAHRAGNMREWERYTRMGDKSYREYQRDQERRAR